MEQIRSIGFPDCKMVTSGAGMFGDPHFDRVENLIKREEARSPYPQNFLADAKNGGLEWLVLYREGMDTSGLDIVDFQGGVYAVVCGIDAQSNEEEMQAVQRFLNLHGLMRDSSRRELGNVIGNEQTKALLGYDQMDYYIPVKQKKIKGKIKKQKCRGSVAFGPPALCAGSRSTTAAWSIFLANDT